MIDGPLAPTGGWPIHSVEEARFAVQVAKDRRYDFIKIYNDPTSEQFDAIVDESRKVGLPVIGHGVRSVGLPAALFRGQVMVAHAEEFYYTTFASKPDYDKLPGVVAETRRSGGYVTANISTIEAIARQWGHPEVRERYFKDPLLRYMSPYSRATWAGPGRDYTRNKGDMQPMIVFLKRFVGELAKQGVPLLAVTDSPVIPGLVPGASLNEELRTLTESGLTSYQVLSAATRTPGEFIVKYVPNAPRFGVVEAGARADLLLVAENPLVSLATLRKPQGVMAAGRWHTAEELHAALEINRENLDKLSRDAFPAAAN
jgi:imidazolonepropionase-like amidohydrolase